MSEARYSEHQVERLATAELVSIELRKAARKNLGKSDCEHNLTVALIHLKNAETLLEAARLVETYGLAD